MNARDSWIRKNLLTKLNSSIHWPQLLAFLVPIILFQAAASWAITNTMLDRHSLTPHPASLGVREFELQLENINRKLDSIDAEMRFLRDDVKACEVAIGRLNRVE